MKKFFLISGLLVAFTISHSNAQSSYITALGLGIDFGVFTDNHGGVVEVLFGDNVTFVNGIYQYHDGIPNALGLQWYAGGGPSLAFFNNDLDVLLRGTVGLDYKINNVPLTFSLDWRPAIFLGGNDSRDSFEAGRFGLGFRYVLN